MRSTFILSVAESSLALESKTAQPLEEVNNETINADELDRALGSGLSKLMAQIYNLKRQELE